MDISNGPGIRISVFTQGCNIYCKGCFNHKLWDKTQGKEWTDKETSLLLELLNNEHIEGITWLGGEPSMWTEDIININKLIKAKYPTKNIWLYTGHKVTDLSKELLKTLDVVVDGPFIEELKDINLIFRGSSNQKIYEVLMVNKLDQKYILKDITDLFQK